MLTSLVSKIEHVGRNDDANSRYVASPSSTTADKRDSTRTRFVTGSYTTIGRKKSMGSAVDVESSTTTFGPAGENYDMKTSLIGKRVPLLWGRNGAQAARKRQGKSRTRNVNHDRSHNRKIRSKYPKSPARHFFRSAQFLNGKHRVLDYKVATPAYVPKTPNARLQRNEFSSVTPWSHSPPMKPPAEYSYLSLALDTNPLRHGFTAHPFSYSHPSMGYPVYTPSSPGLPLDKCDVRHPATVSIDGCSSSKARPQTIETADGNALGVFHGSFRSPNDPRYQLSHPVVSISRSSSKWTPSNVKRHIGLSENYLGHGIVDRGTVSREQNQTVQSSTSNGSKCSLNAVLANKTNQTNLRDGRLEYDPSQPLYSPTYDPDPFRDDSEYDPLFPSWYD